MYRLRAEQIVWFTNITHRAVYAHFIGGYGKVGEFDMKLFVEYLLQEGYDTEEQVWYNFNKYFTNKYPTFVELPFVSFM